MSYNIGFGTAGKPDQGWKLYITSLIMVLSAGLFVIARIATRIWSRQMGEDDYLVLTSLVCKYSPIGETGY